jgi:hypothetical protein
VSATQEVAVGAGTSRGRGRGLRALRSWLVHANSSKQLANPVCQFATYTAFLLLPVSKSLS